MTTRERPILFNGTMVRAILAGQKTVTRRPVRWRVAGFGGGHVEPTDHPGAPTYEPRSTCTVMHTHPDGSICGAPVLRTPAMPGDRLWVRETWCSADWWTTGRSPDPPEHIRYAADNSALDHTSAPPHRIDTSDWSDPKRWRPSIHMPRWASRLSLDVVSVGVERLHAVTDEDAIREGIQGWSKDGALFKYAPADDEGDGPMWPWRDCPRTPRDAFARQWSEVYGAVSWPANPWVWRVEFARAVSR